MQGTSTAIIERAALKARAGTTVEATDQGAATVSAHTVPQCARRARGVFAAHAEDFAILTGEPAPAFHDLTPLVQTVVNRSGIDAGTLLVNSRHTTCAIIVQEHEPLLLRDLAQRLRRFADPDEHYQHNDFEIRTVNMCDGECANGHAHCQHLVLGGSVTLPVVDGQIVLGLWQRIFLVELDRPRPRRYSIQVMGVESDG
jgi:secondary thiamine-phosphate synthase enzyme